MPSKQGLMIKLDLLKKRQKEGGGGKEQTLKQLEQHQRFMRRF